MRHLLLARFARKHPHSISFRASRESALLPSSKRFRASRERILLKQFTLRAKAPPPKTTSRFARKHPPQKTFRASRENITAADDAAM
jgi:hypothetical protein